MAGLAPIRVGDTTSRGAATDSEAIGIGCPTGMLQQKTALFIAGNDRGHFMPFLEAARAIKEEHKIRCELWCHPQVEGWLEDRHTFDIVETCLCSVGVAVRCYKRAATNGDNDQAGQIAVWSNGCAGFIAELWNEKDPAAAFAEIEHSSSEKAPSASLLEKRLLEKDVSICIIENTHQRWWALPIALKAVNKPKILLLAPSYWELFKFYSQTKYVACGDDTVRMRNNLEDLPMPGHERVTTVFVISRCLAENAPLPDLGKYPGEWYRVGPMLQPGLLQGQAAYDALENEHDIELMKWVDTGHPVVLVALGSNSTLNSLSYWAVEELLNGCLETRLRVIFAGAMPDNASIQLKVAVEGGRLRCTNVVPQRALLSSENLVCFISHCGANSTHEALVSATPIVPLPFFDDQYFIAERLERLYYPTHAFSDAATSTMNRTKRERGLRKQDLRCDRWHAAGKVAAAVRSALSVPKEILESLKFEVCQEDGPRKLARLCNFQ